MADSGSHVDSESDAVEYWIFPDLSSIGRDHIGKLEEWRVQCFSVLNERSESYIWHQEGISLVVVPPTKGKQKAPALILSEEAFRIYIFI